MSHKFQNGPPYFLNSFSEGSLGAAGSRTSLRSQWFMSKGHVQQQFKASSQLKREREKIIRI